NDFGSPPTVSQSDVFVLRNQGNGTFSQSSAFPTGLGAAAVRTGDIDGDGLTDVVTVNYNAASVSILRNTGTGIGSINFDTKIDLAGMGQSLDVVLTDINRDGKPDLISLRSNSSGFDVFMNTSTEGNISFDGGT